MSKAKILKLIGKFIQNQTELADEIMVIELASQDLITCLKLLKEDKALQIGRAHV